MNKWLLLLAVPVLLGAALFGGGSGSGAGGGDHSHFDTQCESSNKVLCASLRTSSNIETHHAGANAANYWSYDSSQDAARQRFDQGENLSLASDEQLWLDYSSVDESNASAYSVQYEIKFEEDYADTPVTTLGTEPLTNHKLVRVDNTAATEERVIEIPQSDYADTNDVADGDKAVAIYRIRSYGFTFADPDVDAQNPIRIDDGTALDEQPGGDTGAWTDHNPWGASDHVGGDEGDGHLKPYVFTYDTWYRVTVCWEDFDLGTGNVKLTTTISDENTDSKTVFESVDNPGTGLLAERSTFTDTGSNRLRLEVNTSQSNSEVQPADGMDMWFRNVIIWKDACIPQGGRPG